MKIARVLNGKVRETRVDFIDAAEAKKKAPLPAEFGDWFDVAGDVRDGWDHDGTTATAPVEPPADKIKRLKAHADHIAREKIKAATGAPTDDATALRLQVSMLSKAVWLLRREIAGKNTAKQKTELGKLEVIGDKKESLEAARDKIKTGITDKTTETEIDTDVRWPA